MNNKRHRMRRLAVGLARATLDLQNWTANASTATTLWGDDVGTADWLFDNVKRRYAAWQREATRCVELEGSKDDDE